MHPSRKPGSRRLPPLNPLRAFEATARHLSFTKAAEELSVTQGAVSRSVSALEDYLGFSLFERLPGSLAIDQANQQFAHAVTDAFSRISDALDDLVEHRTHTLLAVRTYTALMTRWLIPNLPQFHLLRPEIEVCLIAANERVRFEHDFADVRIRYGHGKWRNFHSVFLLPDEIMPLCSPRLLKDGRLGLDDLRHATLLCSNMRRHDWSDWLASVGMDDFAPAKERHFEEASVMLEAALAGLGIAITQRAFVQEELRSGRLVAPFPHVLRRDAGYYATYPKSGESSPAVIAFCEWLHEITAPARSQPT
jgi:LysR family glycine cleavage system transcriptional activator